MPGVTGAGLIVSPDGKYLFAAGQWKSAAFLETLRRRGEVAANGR